MTKYSYTKEVNSDRLTQEITQSAITIAIDHLDCTSSTVDVWFKAELSVGEVTILDAIVNAHINSELDKPLSMTTLSEIEVTWTMLKVFYTANAGSFIDYADFGDYYFICLTFRSHKMYVHQLNKNTTEATDFVTNYVNKEIRLPSRFLPDQNLLEYHRQNIFRG